jgi:CoA:oxalate CoA-transferase
VFRCADGYVSIVAVSEAMALGLFRSMGRPELAADARFDRRDHRVANAKALEAEVEAWTSSLPCDEVVRRLEAEGVATAKVRTPSESLSDARVVARQETQAVHHPSYDDDLGLRTAGVPIQFSACRTGFDEALPVRVGQDNEAVYKGLLGYSDERLADLRDRNVI